MKETLFFIALLFTTNSYAQSNAEIPNHEFDNWDSNTNPSYWSTLEDAIGSGNGIVEEDQIDVQNGDASLKLVTPQPTANVNYSIVALGNLIYNDNLHRLVSSGVDYHTRPDSVWVLYKYSSPANDTAAIAITLESNNGGNPINILNVLYPMAQSAQWQLKSYKLSTQYTSNATSDTMYVSLISSASQARTPNSTLQVDGIYFNNPSNATAINNVSVSRNISLYPNPLLCGSKLNIKSTQTLTRCMLHLIDVLGKEVQCSTIDNNNAIRIDAVTAGSYFWFITDKQDNLIGKGQLKML